MVAKITAALLVSILLGVASAVHVDRAGEFPSKDCPKCDEDSCPKAGTDCPQGLVPDICGCCPEGVCGLGEGAKCFNGSLIGVLPPESRKYGLCGANLHCLLRSDLTSRDEPEALCYCKETQPACASNNRTYDSVCQMHEDALKTGTSLYLKHWGPCNSVPWVTSGPEDVIGALQQSVALDCEAKGFPIPEVHWEFRADSGDTRVLPSDDQYVAVQVRGGPEPLMVTTWVQIVSLRPSDTGTYTCVATNSEGVARASAAVGVRG